MLSMEYKLKHAKEELNKIVKKMGLSKKWKHGDVVQLKKDVDRTFSEKILFRKSKAGKSF